MIGLILTLLAQILAAAKVGGVSSEVVALIQAAYDKAIEVHGTDVTYTQLEGLRASKQW